MTLTDEIRKFTENAYKKFSPDYTQTFRNPIERLIAENLGKNAPRVGAAFPDFVLEDHQAKQKQGSQHWNDKNPVLKFHRGGWCWINKQKQYECFSVSTKCLGAHQ